MHFIAGFCGVKTYYRHRKKLAKSTICCRPQVNINCGIQIINQSTSSLHIFHSPYTCSQVFIGFNLHSGYNLCFLAVFSISCFVVDLLNLPCWGLSLGSNRRRSSSKQTCRCTKVRIYTKSIIKFISINPQLFCLLYKCMYSFCNSIK